MSKISVIALGALGASVAMAWTLLAAPPPPRPTGGAQDHASTTAPPFPDRAERLELYKGLLAAIRKYHVFSSRTERNLGRKWSDDLPRLEAEFRAAETPEKLFAAINHLQNSLHNAHCTYNSPARPERLTAGFGAEVEWQNGAPVFYVAEILDKRLAQQLAVGDIIVAMDGMPASAFMEQLSLEATANSREGLAQDIAEYLGKRRTYWSATRLGDKTRWKLKRRKTGLTFEVTTEWQRYPSAGASSEEEPVIDYASKACGELPERAYGPYKLKESGINFCLYTSEVAPYAAYPIVRHFSFLYSEGRSTAQALRLDQRLLKQGLALLSKAKGVILDLRDNGGGNNPNWFFDWWAPAAYVDHFVDVRLHEDFGDEGRLSAAQVTGWGPREVADYLAALKRRKPGQRFMPRRAFFCQPKTCQWENRYTPRHRVTELPIALLVGASCVSACDEFAQVFNENGFGPLVGEQPASAFTAFRINLPVQLPRTRMELGFMRLAFSQEVSGRTGEDVEARPLRIDAPVARTFANRDRYDALLVEAAIHSFATYRFPPARR